MMSTSTVQVYVGTYAKYNSGSIAGEWLDLEDYADKDEFLEACAELHDDEDYPEFMFQDWEGIPDGLISESHIDEDVWEWLELDEDDREKVDLYREHIDSDADFQTCIGRYMGQYRNPTDYAEEWYNERREIPEYLVSYIDWERVARDFELGGDVTFVQTSYDVCHVFDNH